MEPTVTVPSVLIVEPSLESREVLRTVLQRRGVQILETDEASEGVELARQHQPQVIVLDLEAKSADDESIRDQYDAESKNGQSSLVILGKATRYEQTLPKDRVVQKPYHYAPLIRTIEQLLKAA